MRLKRLLGIVFSTAAAVLIGGYALLSSYDYNALAPKIALAVKASTGRELKLRGPISFRPGLSPSLVAEDVGLQNAAWGSRPDLAEVKRLEIRIALLPLIFKEIKIKRLILIEPDLLFETDPSGRSNFAFEQPADSASGGSGGRRPDGGEASLPAVLIDKIRIEMGRFAYIDGKSGRRFLLKLNRFSAAAQDGEKQIDLNLEGRFNGLAFTAKGTVLDPAALTRPGAFSAFDLKAKIGEAALTLRGRVRDLAHMKDFSLALTANGTVSEIAGLAGLTAPPGLGPFDLSARLSDRDGKLRLDQLRVSIGREGSALCRLSGVVDDLKKGQGIACLFSARAADASDLEKVFRRPIPLSGPFEISGGIENPEKGLYRLAGIRATLAQSAVQGSAEVNLSGQRPRIAAEFSSTKMDLRSVLAKEEETGKPVGQNGPRSEARIFSRKPLPFSALERFDAVVRFKAGQILLPHMAFRDVGLNLFLKGGNLKAEPIRLGVGGGALEGRLELDSRGGKGSASTAFKIHHFDLGRMLKDLEVDEGLEGKIDADVALSGRGGSAAELTASLSGKVIVAMGKGRIDNRYIEMLGADLSSSIFRMLNPFKEKIPYTGFNCFVSRFEISDGLAKSNALVFDSDRMGVVGDGEIDLRTEKMDLSLRPVPKNGIGIKGVGKISLSLGQLTKPFKLGGTLARPSLAVDPGQTAIALGKVVGGVVLFGPVGIAAALADCDPNEENPCLSAMEALKTDVAEPKCPREEEEKGTNQSTAAGVVDGIKGVFEGAGRMLKEVFGR